MVGMQKALACFPRPSTLVGLPGPAFRAKPAPQGEIRSVQLLKNGAGLPQMHVS